MAENGTPLIAVPGGTILPAGAGMPAAQPIYFKHGGTLTRYVHPKPEHVDNLTQPAVAIPAGTLLFALAPEQARQILAMLKLRGIDLEK